MPAAASHARTVPACVGTHPRPMCPGLLDSSAWGVWHTCTLPPDPPTLPHPCPSQPASWVRRAALRRARWCAPAAAWSAARPVCSTCLAVHSRMTARVGGSCAGALLAILQGSVPATTMCRGCRRRRQPCTLAPTIVSSPGLRQQHMPPDAAEICRGYLLDVRIGRGCARARVALCRRL